MASLFGREWTRRELTARVGDLGQLAGIKPHLLTDGPSRGVEAVDVWTGSGLAFTVVPGRGMDIHAASYAGRSLCWHSGTGLPAAGRFEATQGLDWLKTFAGGLVVTCGLRTFGFPCVDDGESVGLHGLASNIPARNVTSVAHWDGDGYQLEVSGTVREASVLQYDVIMTRTISTQLGAKSFRIHDRVGNVDQTATPHMMLYHINLGFPVVDEGSEMLLKADTWSARDEEAADGQDERMQFHTPVRGYNEKVYLYEPKPGPDGYWIAAVVNRKHQKGHPLGVYVKASHETLPHMTQWKMMGEHTYVVGIEPCNCPMATRAELRERGLLQSLEPGESRRYELEIGVVTTEAELKQLEEAVARCG